MKKIILLSDTHSHLDEEILQYLKTADEVWHAGDFGNMETTTTLKQHHLTQGVYGNIDDKNIQAIFPFTNIFYCEEVKVMMQHIGGYPAKYAQGVKDKILKERPAIFISGHSHILKIMYDKQLNCLHMNPGAAGRQGWHKVRTMISFVIDKKNIKDCNIIELSGR